MPDGWEKLSYRLEPCPAPLLASLQLEGVPMDMPDGWKRALYFRVGWRKGGYWITGTPGMYMWFKETERGEHGGFPDPVSCAVACELATGGCTDGHA